MLYKNIAELNIVIMNYNIIKTKKILDKQIIFAGIQEKMYKELQQLKKEFEEIKSNVSLTQQILSGNNSINVQVSLINQD